MGKNNQNFNIRPAIVEDALAINSVLQKTFIATYPCPELGISKGDIEEYTSSLLTTKSVERRSQDILNGGYYVAEDAQKVCGLARLKSKDGHHVLRSLYILPENQCRGIGQALWEMIKKDIKDDIYVYVVDYNIRAIAFYESAGFVKTGSHIKEDRITFGGVVVNQVEMVYKQEKNI